MTALQMAGLFLGGGIGDRSNAQYVRCACWATSAGLIALTYGADPALVIAFAVAHGFGLGVRAPHGCPARRLFWPQILRHHHGYFVPNRHDGYDPWPAVSGIMFDIYMSMTSFTCIAFCSLIGALSSFGRWAAQAIGVVKLMPRAARYTKLRPLF